MVPVSGWLLGVAGRKRFYMTCVALFTASSLLGLKVDWQGFVLVALFLGCLEIVLDEGQTADWFSSTFIVISAVISAASFLAFVPWELSRKDPIVDIRLI